MLCLPVLSITNLIGLGFRAYKTESPLFFFTVWGIIIISKKRFFLLRVGIMHVFSCICICGVPRKLFENEAIRPSVLTLSEGPVKL